MTGWIIAAEVGIIEEKTWKGRGPNPGRHESQAMGYRDSQNRTKGKEEKKNKDKKEMQFPFHNIGESIIGLLGVAGRWSLWEP